MPTIPLIVVEEKLAIASLVYLPCTFKIAVETIYKESINIIIEHTFKYFEKRGDKWCSKKYDDIKQ